MTQERSETTRKQILEAAVTCFARQGYDKTSTTTIAKEAGVSQGIIFHYFSTKEGLFAGIVRTGIDQLQEVIKNAYQSTLTPADKIKLFMRLMSEQALNNPALSEIIIRQILSNPVNLEKIETLGITRVIQMITEIFDEGKRLGSFVDIDTQTAAMTVLGLYLSNYIGWSGFGKSYDFGHALQRACDMFLYGIVKRG